MLLIQKTAKKITDEMEKQGDVIDLAFVVLRPFETEKARLVVAPGYSVAEIFYDPNGKPGTDEESREKTPSIPNYHQDRSQKQNRELQESLKKKRKRNKETPIDGIALNAFRLCSTEEIS